MKVEELLPTLAAACFHWYDNAPEPLAVAVKVTEPPSTVVGAVGAIETVGATFTVNVAVLLVVEVAVLFKVFVTTQV